MPDLTKTLDERVFDLESVYVDIPQLINTRFETSEARINVIDKQMAMLIRDMRDFRAGVTLQLKLQDQKLSRMEADITGVKSDVATMKSDMTVMKSDVTTMKSSISEILTILRK